MHGLGLTSEVPLNGLAPVATHGSAPDISIAWGKVPEALQNPLISNLVVQIGAGNQMLVTLPGTARFLLQGGSTITVQMTGDRPEEVGALLSPAVLALLMQQRGEVPLRASVVANQLGAVALCGVSNAGKSTLAAALVQRGMTLVSDDFCLIKSINGEAMVLPGAGPAAAMA